MPAWLVPSSSIPSRSSQPWIDPDLETFTKKEASLVTAEKSGGLPGSWQDPVPRGLFPSIPFLAQPHRAWLGTVLRPLWEARKAQSTTESLRNTPFTWHHFLPVSTFYPQKALCLSPPPVPTHREASSGWLKAVMVPGGCPHGRAGQKAARESHCPAHLAAHLHLMGVTESEV